MLGLADCRVLGRIVDASLLVVRSGSHQLMTLHRAKAMLEQSHVVIAGVVFNGLTEDMNNWSSYGYEPLPLSGGRLERTAGAAATAEPLATGGDAIDDRPAPVACRPTLRTRLTVNLRPRILLATDRVLAAALVALVLGSVVVFRRRGLVVSPGGRRRWPSCWPAPSSRSSCLKGGCRS